MVDLTLETVDRRIAELQTALSQSSQQLITVRNVVAAVETQVARLRGGLEEMNRLKAFMQAPETEKETENDISEDEPSLDEDPQ